MPRAKNKTELLESAKSEFAKLMNIIEAMPEEVQNAEFGFEGRDRNVRDVLIHLYEWHLLLLHFINANTDNLTLRATQNALDSTDTNSHPKSRTKKPSARNPIPFLPPPYNWKTYPQMNIEIWQKHQNTSLSKAIQSLKQSHNEVLSVIEKLSDEELFTKKLWSWCGELHLGSYCISASPSHYVWGINLLKKHAKTCKA